MIQMEEGRPHVCELGVMCRPSAWWSHECVLCVLGVCVCLRCGVLFLYLDAVPVAVVEQLVEHRQRRQVQVRDALQRTHRSTADTEIREWSLHQRIDHFIPSSLTPVCRHCTLYPSFLYTPFQVHVWGVPVRRR